MYFDSREIGHRQQFREQRADVLEMRENALGALVRFATEDFVAVDAEFVKKILFLGRSFLDKSREPGFDRVEFSGMHFKIGMQTDEIWVHAPIVTTNGHEFIRMFRLSI